MFSRLGQIADRYFITLVFIGLGWANAESWPYFLPFVVFGAAVDIWFVKPRPIIPYEMLSGEERHSARAKWTKLLVVAIGCPAAALVIWFVTAGLMRKSPETIEWTGPVLYEWASPYIALLRSHHTDLISNGLPHRANFVAFFYAQLFSLFYAALALWLVQIRSIGALDHPRTQDDKPRRRKLLHIAMLLLVPLLLLYLVHCTTWIDIDYNDHEFRRRHINTNVADYNSFFFHLAIRLGAFGVTVSLLHLLVRTAPIVFSMRAVGRQSDLAS